MRAQADYRGFSLLELSIVLVIIGLLAGGVMVGQDLVRQAEVRAITAEYMTYRTATNAFRNKYSALPGDFRNATAYWGKDNTYCSTQTGTAAVPGTCSGNGDGFVAHGATGAATGESFQFWKQLNLAGLIEGNYTGIAGSDRDDCDLGTNAPNSRMSGAGWGVDEFGFTGSATMLALNYGRQRYVFGAGTSSDLPYNVALTPAEAYAIDLKIDDGLPGRGNIAIGNWPTCTNATVNTDLDTTYRLTNAGIGCSLFFFNML